MNILDHPYLANPPILTITQNQVITIMPDQAHPVHPMLHFMGQNPVQILHPDPSIQEVQPIIDKI
jgi:hypothetical protein